MFFLPETPPNTLLLKCWNESYDDVRDTGIISLIRLFN